MPVQTAHINDIRPIQVIEWRIGNNWGNPNFTGATSYAICADDNPFFNFNSYYACKPNERTANNLQLFYKNKKFVEFDLLFKQQFEKLKPYLEGIEFEAAKLKMSQSLNSLLEIEPDIISMELTHEQSIFYTLKKDNYSFYIQHFLNVEDIEDDEATLTVFKGDDKLPSFAGSLTDTIFEVNNMLLPNTALKFELQYNEEVSI